MNSAIANSLPMQAKNDVVPKAPELKPMNLLKRIEAQLHEIFEGRQEFLGCTPD